MGGTVSPHPYADDERLERVLVGLRAGKMIRMAPPFGARHAAAERYRDGRHGIGV